MRLSNCPLCVRYDLHKKLSRFAVDENRRLDHSSIRPSVFRTAVGTGSLQAARLCPCFRQLRHVMLANSTPEVDGTASTKAKSGSSRWRLRRDGGGAKFCIGNFHHCQVILTERCDIAQQNA
ncbi:hypothetical protein RN001_004171 [Aquatica leii]|uniref:Uncharacterized protein n=1 Tax=Aquatica leii TaxID=1421715 RepID=A0AAN7PZN4_9COLE|nr:hypothetical protein RN001_004171 [Aquatica leii]